MSNNINDIMKEIVEHHEDITSLIDEFCEVSIPIASTEVNKNGSRITPEAAMKIAELSRRTPNVPIIFEREDGERFQLNSGGIELDPHMVGQRLMSLSITTPDTLNQLMKEKSGVINEAVKEVLENIPREILESNIPSGSELASMIENNKINEE